MKVIEQTPTRLVLKDEQTDKKLGLTLAGGFLAMVAIVFVTEGAWVIAGTLAAAGLALVVYSRYATATSLITFDKTADTVELTTSEPTSALGFRRSLGEIVRADVRHRHLGEKEAGDSTFDCPILVFRDGDERPLRAYQSAGTQSRETAAIISDFLNGAMPMDTGER
jgi:hypothetical protein